MAAVVLKAMLFGVTDSLIREFLTGIRQLLVFVLG